MQFKIAHSGSVFPVTGVPENDDIPCKWKNKTYHPDQRPSAEEKGVYVVKPDAKFHGMIDEITGSSE
jgi:hypothetical protein